jgi:hypothetical protein
MWNLNVRLGFSVRVGMCRSSDVCLTDWCAVPCGTSASLSRLPGTDVPGCPILPLRGWTLFSRTFFCELFFSRACHARPKHWKLSVCGFWRDLCCRRVT